MKRRIPTGLITSFVIALSFSLMLFLYEPIIMYLSNTTDFWFDIYTLIGCSLVGFIILFLAISLVYILIYGISKKFKNIYNVFLIIGFIVFIVTYIQGNYLAGSLPTLDGNIIDWSNYKIESLISLILLLAVTGGMVVCVRKFNYDKVIKWSRNITLAICVMLLVSLVTTCATTRSAFVKKEFTTTATTNYISEYSTSKNNLIILMLDSIDSETMEKIVKKNKEYVNVFQDFTYYPDTVGAYPFTRDTVPFILSGHWSENKKDFAAYYNEAMDNSVLLDNLRANKYNINIYNDEISYNTEKAHDIKNFSFNNKVNLVSFLKQEIKFDLFKYLPYYLKKYSRIQGMDFIGTRKMVEDELFNWEDTTFINDYLNREMKDSTNNEFKYIHLEGAHYPFDVDENFQKKESGTYEDKITGSIKLIDKYLNYLKENNVYDNSAIVILADHGFWWETDDDSLLKRQNPILYIKGINEKHERKISSEQVSFANLQDIYKGLIEGKKTKDLFENIDTSKPRRFLLYRVGGYNHMEEFYQHGHSKDLKSLEKTENVYELEVK